MLQRLLFAPLFVAASACASYQSDYHPPADGRARVVFDDNHVAMSVDSTNDACLRAADEEADTPTYRYVHRGGGGGAVVVWVPPPVVVVGPAPIFHPHNIAPLHRTPAHGFGAIGGAAGHGGRNDVAKEAYIAVAVAVLLASPFIAYGLSFSRPEPEEESAQTIDRVNAYNDVARSPGSPCAQVPMQVPAQ